MIEYNKLHTNNITKINVRNFAIEVKVPARPLNPSTAAITARIKNIIAHSNIFTSYIKIT
jgi:hypothetical protein